MSEKKGMFGLLVNYMVRMYVDPLMWGERSRHYCPYYFHSFLNVQTYYSAGQNTFISFIVLHFLSVWFRVSNAKYIWDVFRHV